MPVKSSETSSSWAFEATSYQFDDDDEFDSISSDDLLSTDSLPSVDIWKKFEFCDLPLSEFSQSSTSTSLDGDMELEPLLEWSLDQRNSMYGLDMMMINGCISTKDTANEIRHHDCMWAGHCGSKEHKPENIKVSRPLLNQTSSTGVAVTVVAAAAATATTTPSAPVTPTPKQRSNTTTVQPLSAATTATNNAGRSLLLNSRNNIRRDQQQTTSTTSTTTTTASGTTTSATSAATSTTTNVGPRPDSPPSSDDDDHPRFKHEIITIFEQSAENKTLQFLNDAISECDFEEDSDLCDYFEDSDMFAGGETTDNSPRSSYPGESDHSYHKGKGAQLRTDHLGVQTPSDSEEEIDVVSVGEKQQTTGRNCNTVLPTNPSIRDRQKLQRTVASAISNKREYNNQVHPQSGNGGSGGGIKTRLPLRIPNTNSPVASSHQERNSNNTSSSNTLKKSSNGRTDNRRGVKRGRHHRYQKTTASSASASGSSSGSGGGGSPAKRRGYAHSSDSDTECSEKRSLHNNMERQRRVDLRNAFDDLRVLVPEVACKERAAKVVILREAAAYCDFLGNESANQLKQTAELRRQQERLRARVSQLRRSLAAKR